MARLNSRVVWGGLAAAALALSPTFAQDGLAGNPIDWLSLTLMVPAYALLLAAAVFGLLCGYGVRLPVLGERFQEPSFPILPDPPPDDPRSDIRQALDSAGSPGELREALDVASPAQSAALSADQRWLRLVNQLVEEVGWDTWQDSVYPFFDPNVRWIEVAFTQSIQRATEWILSRAWPPGHPELREAMDTYGRVISDLLLTFRQHAETSPDGVRIMTEPFYKNHGNWNPRYHEDLADYEHHVELLEDLVLEATRYANYIADLVRSGIDPDFRADEGALLVRMTYGVFQIGLLKPEFRPEDFVNGRPYKDLQAFDGDRGSRDVSMKAD